MGSWSCIVAGERFGRNTVKAHLQAGSGQIQNRIIIPKRDISYSRIRQSLAINSRTYRIETENGARLMGDAGFSVTG